METDMKKVPVEWYDNPGIVTNFIIALIAVIIIFCLQMLNRFRQYTIGFLERKGSFSGFKNS